MFFSNTHWTQLLAPLQIFMSKIVYYKEVYSYSYSQFWAVQGDYEHEMIQPWLPVSQKYKYEAKQSPNSLNHHHNDKKQRIYFWCAEKDNLASQISEVALRKEPEPWKCPFPP